MIGVFAGAMTTVMALVLFCAVIPLGGVNPILLAAAFGLVLLLSVIWAGRILIIKDLTWNRSPMHWPMLVFLAYSAARYYTSPFEYEARNELFQVGLCGLLFFVASQQFHQRRDRAIFVAVLAVIAVFQSGFGMWQAFTHSDAIFHWERPEGYNGRGSGTFVCPNHLAGFLELTLGLLVARAVIVRRESKSIERSVILKVLIIYAAVMAVAGILVTLSRSGWLATVIGLSALLFLGEWRLRSVLPRAALVLAVLTFMAFMLWNVDSIRNYVVKSLRVDNQTQGISLSDPTMGGRAFMWGGTVKMIRDAPLVGTGIGSWQWVYQRYKTPGVTASEPDYTHNDYLNLAADYGLVGFVIMLAVFICFFVHAGRIAKTAESSEQRAFAVGAMLSVISIMVHSWFDFNLHIPANSFLLAAIMGFTAAMGDRQRRLPAKAAPPIARYALAATVLCVGGIGVRLFLPTVLAYHHTDLGNGAKWDLDYDAAFSHYGRASALDPKYPEPHVRTGDIYLSSANWRKGPAKAGERRSLANKAIEAYERALALNPLRAYVRVSKARAQELAGEDELALQSYLQAVETSPINAYAWYMLGCYYRDRGQDEKAFQAFAKANEYFNYSDPTFQMNAAEALERRGTAQPKK
jgi:O-antigen ligase